MNFSIEVKTRTEKSAVTRAQGLIPGVLYGQKIKPISVFVNGIVFEKLYKQAGESNLIDLQLDGKNPGKVLIQDVQIDPVRGNIIHVDLMQIDMGKEIHATVPINFVNEAPAVKELGGTLIKALQELNIKCLPKDLVGQIDFDLSGLKTFDDVIHVRELILPSGIVVTDSADVVVAKVNKPLTEEEFKAMEEGQVKDIATIEVEGEKEKAEKEAALAAEGEKEKKEESKAPKAKEKTE